MKDRSASTLIRAVATVAASAFLFVACSKKDDAVAAAAKADKAAGVPAPGIEETKAIAEEGFIYGLPIVMNYAVMYEFVVDKNSGQYKAPFNQIANEARVFTYEDTAVVTPNSDTPYSMLWLDLRAEPMVISVPAVEKKRYYSVQLIDGNTYNYGYIGSRATGNGRGRLSGGRPGLEGRDAGRRSRRSSGRRHRSRLAIFRTQLFDPDDMPNVEKVQAGYKAQPLSAFLEAAGPGGRARRSTFRRSTTDGDQGQLLRVPRLRAAVRAGDADEDKEIRAKLARIGVGPGKTFDFKDLSLEHKAAVLLGMKEGDDKVDKCVASRDEERQRLERRLALRRSRLLQRRLAEARRCRQGAASTATMRSRRCIR